MGSAPGWRRTHSGRRRRPLSAEDLRSSSRGDILGLGGTNPASTWRAIRANWRHDETSAPGGAADVADGRSAAQPAVGPVSNHGPGVGRRTQCQKSLRPCRGRKLRKLLSTGSTASWQSTLASQARREARGISPRAPHRSDLVPSTHPARATARRLPPSTEQRGPRANPWPKSAGDDPPPSLQPHYKASVTPRGTVLAGASVSGLRPMRRRGADCPVVVTKAL